MSDKGHGGAREGAGRPGEVADDAPALEPTLQSIKTYICWAVAHLDSGGNATRHEARMKALAELTKALRAEHSQCELEESRKILAEIKKTKQEIAALVAEKRRLGLK